MSGGDETRRRIEAELLAWMGEEPWRDDDARFGDLALRLFAFQFEHCAAYGRFCEARGMTPNRVSTWREIPPVPAGGFKELPLRCFPERDTVKTFRTSGTSTDRRGELHLDTLALYEASLLPTLRALLLPDLAPGERLAIRVLAPSPDVAPDSSLSHMFGLLVEACGSKESAFDVDADGLCYEPLTHFLENASADDRPVVVAGTAFAFVHLLDAMEERGAKIRAPEGSRIMETGGFKGRSRSVEKPALHRALADAFEIPDSRIVNQYGMTELGSQFYDSVLVDPNGPRRKLGPPWARVRVCDPRDGSDAEDGQVGMIVVHDLANTGSVAAVQTEDLGRRIGADGFEVIGRAEGAEARGCSVAADEMLGGPSR